MQANDPIADMLTRIRNAVLRGKKEVRVPHSKMKAKVAEILSNEGYLDGYNTEDSETSKAQKDLVLSIKYQGKQAAIRGLKRVSRPGVRIYMGYRDIPVIKNGMGVNIISTSRGLMTGKDAIEQKAGGELLCNIW